MCSVYQTLCFDCIYDCSVYTEQISQNGIYRTNDTKNTYIKTACIHANATQNYICIRTEYGSAHLCTYESSFAVYECKI